MHLFTSWCPQGSSKQRNNSAAGEVIFRTDQSKCVVSIFVQVVIIIYFILLFLLSSNFLYLLMMNNVNLTRGSLVILTTYKLILLTVLQSRKIGSAYAFVYFLVSTGNFKATKYLNCRRSYFPD